MKDIRMLSEAKSRQKSGKKLILVTTLLLSMVAMLNAQDITLTLASGGKFTVNDSLLVVDETTGNVGVGTATLDASALLDINATDKGILMPKMALASLTDETLVSGGVAAHGLTVFATGGALAEGYYYWDNTGGTWVRLIEADDVDLRIVGSDPFFNHITIDAGVDGNGTSAGTGGNNIAIGPEAGYSLTTGIGNIAFGFRALTENTSGTQNIANGSHALHFNTTGNYNVATGSHALFWNDPGNHNVANGSYALYFNSTGNNNVANGSYALYLNSTGSNNVASGYYALAENWTGNNNTVIGNDTGRGINTGSSNTIIGANVTGLTSTLSNNIIIADGDGNRRINVDAIGNVGMGTPTPGSKLAVVSLPTYADNTAATGGGLLAGDFYRTATGVLMVTF